MGATGCEFEATAPAAPPCGLGGIGVQRDGERLLAGRIGDEFGLDPVDSACSMAIATSFWGGPSRVLLSPPRPQASSGVGTVTP
jgi:hypothetical protein